ncbi:MAG: tRNA glutamyl-Q(34) synthetase GluQRS [Methylophilaceae bacterium]|nr:tRNA glutamyl-Q(34) synthetase GluQRS [Methylophilaceae bacterium]
MYRGRFAPSPTGPLHFGSLIAAVASYLDAKSHHGRWLLRIEDLDSPRTVAGASDAILNSLEAFGFEWDEDVVYQSQRTDLYEKYLDILKSDDLVYPCTCSRKEIADSAIQGIDGAIYPGTCRHGPAKDKQARAWRVRTYPETITFEDAVQGHIEQNIAEDIGDFVLKRADGLFAYQLAVVVDDAEQDITDVVRGADLLDSTPRQIYLQRLLALPTPKYLHVPVASNAAGEKLSKQTLAEAIDPRHANTQLWIALDFLGQSPPIDLQRRSLQDLWSWAASHWQVSTINKKRLKANDPRY